MTDLLLVEKVAREICIALGDEPDREGPFDEWYKGSAYETMAKIAIAASDRAAEQRAQPVTVASPGYEAGLVEGFKQGIEAAASLCDETARRAHTNEMYPAFCLNATHSTATSLAVIIRALSPPSIADDGKEGAG